MSKNKYAIVWEFLKTIAGIGIIYYYGGWFGADESMPWITTVLTVYLILSFIVTTWFVLYDLRKPAVKSIAVQNA